MSTHIPSAYITLRDLSYTTPDGRPLFTAVNLTLSDERTGLVGRNGSGKTTLLRLIDGTVQPTSGSLTRRGTIGILNQIPQLGSGRTVAEEAGVAEALARIARIVSGTADEHDYELADWTLESQLTEVLAQFGLAGMDTDRPLDSLSGGQRTRVALAGLVLSGPDMVLLDEPTNNLDRDGRTAVAEFLAGWRGGAVVVSHDRELLRRMDRIVEISEAGVRLYGGNWDFYAERRAEEAQAAAQDLARAQRAVNDAERQAQEARERQERRNAAGKRSRDSAGMSKLALDARKDRAGRTQGRGSVLADKTRQQVELQLNAASARVERQQSRNFRLADGEPPPGKRIVVLDGISGGPPGAPQLIRDCSLVICSGERVALTGPNGSGKTTLLRLIDGALPPSSGTVSRFGAIAMLDQDVGLLEPGATIRDNFRRINPQATENACRAALARFLFRSDAALQQVSMLSGGEKLRAGLACVLGGPQPPDLLILDEPTNHLDLASIEAMEEGLRAYGGALLVVSHDAGFLEAIGIERYISVQN